MGLIAFPFIVCLIFSPFIVGGIILYMRYEEKKRIESSELLRKRAKAGAWVMRELQRTCVIPTDEDIANVRKKAFDKFGVEPL